MNSAQFPKEQHSHLCTSYLGLALTIILTFTAALPSIAEASTQDDGVLYRKTHFLRRAVRGTSFKASKDFGNIIGAVRLRKGHLKKNFPLRALLEERLRPGDLLFEKTSAALTDKFIPGRLGHVGLYLGTGQDLKNLGYEVRPRDLNVPLIAEALRSDVQLNSLRHFMNVDEIYILRPNYSSDADIKLAFDRAFRYLGYSYDFLFDLKDDSNIYCTELIARALPEIPWQLENHLGLRTLSVDDLFIQAMAVHRFEPIAAVFYGVFYDSNGGDLRTRLEQLFKIHPDGTPIETGDSQL